MKLKILLLLASLFLPLSSALAENMAFSSPEKQATLLELFTSEGCSSCPPAEHWMNQLVDDDRLWQSLVPIVFHVDYWDYIGWKDRYASADYSNRQRRYYKEGGVSTVYTPGMVQNGKEWRGWWRSQSIPQTDKSVGVLSAKLADNVLKVHFDASTKSLTLNVAVLGFGLESAVKAGENAGKILHHEFVVLGQKAQISDDNEWQINLPTTKKVHTKRKAIAIWVSPANQQRPIQAAGAWLE